MLRRTNQQLVAYKLKCEREPLSVRLGPPDFYPPAPNCAEEVLNRDSCVNGYKEIIDGVEESNEAKLSLTSQAYNSLWNKQNVNRYKEAIRKRLRALNNALVRKRKAGQVYALPLTGSLLAKPGIFPEQRTCGEDFRKKWIEDLSQRKRLRSLAEHVPHGYRRRSLFEALIKHEVPLIRATWFVKILYLNQIAEGEGMGLVAGFFLRITYIFSVLSNMVYANIAVDSSSKPRSFNNFLNHIASASALDKAMYSASVEESATEESATDFCFFDVQLMVPPLSWKQYPEVDRLVSRQPPQSASECPVKPDGLSTLVNTRPKSRVPFRYRKILLTAFQCINPGFDMN
ncbi:hypothetical protein AXG93_3105s1410 [Marchantia polymorpha subsp. ruderalis]|uniref:Mediator complex subunit Med12 domain-containing protein n=1 Tax=Marchantia polymorpha subsp. ruderalis TaxID=1480154 RepID=A0A176WKS4_MARPO|nr:hypothetical protein AXG93_3105s1410 [Marchantia polymorpha subsp. ruderalis]